MRRPAKKFVSEDNSPGFRTLLNNNDNNLRRLKMTIVKTDRLNKNANAVDKECQKLEEEMKNMEAEW